MARERRPTAAIVLTMLTIALGMPGTALAYLDPTSGSMLLQLLLGGAAGVAVAAKLLWRRIVSHLPSRDRDDANS
jgi:hypothetical protein